MELSDHIQTDRSYAVGFRQTGFLLRGAMEDTQRCKAILPQCYVRDVVESGAWRRRSLMGSHRSDVSNKVRTSSASFVEEYASAQEAVKVRDQEYLTVSALYH